MPMTDHDILLAIQELLDGRVWTADTFNAIATLLNDNGYRINDVTPTQEDDMRL
jgi:hypothetical protein